MRERRPRPPLFRDLSEREQREHCQLPNGKAARVVEIDCGCGLTLKTRDGAPLLPCVHGRK